jgi:hypothetical protein
MSSAPASKIIQSEYRGGNGLASVRAHGFRYFVSAFIQGAFLAALPMALHRAQFKLRAGAPGDIVAWTNVNSHNKTDYMIFKFRPARTFTANEEHFGLSSGFQGVSRQ